MELELSDIIGPKFLLRPVDKRGVSWVELVESMRTHGLLSAITVRPTDRLGAKYEVVAGNHRYEAAKELNWKTIPAIIVEAASDEDVLRKQIVENAVRTDTKRSDYARQLARIKSHFSLTLTELAGWVGKSTTWVAEQLAILNLPDYAVEAIDAGKIDMNSVLAMARLPVKFITPELVAKAEELGQTKFRAYCFDLRKKYQEDWNIRRLKENEDHKRSMRAYLRSTAEIREWAENKDKLHEVAAFVMRNHVTTPLEGFMLALQWALNIDPETLAKRRNEIEKVEQRDLKALYKSAIEHFS